MDFRNIKSLSIGGQPVSKLLIGGRLAWQKAEPEPVVEGAYIETDGVASFIDIGFTPSGATTFDVSFRCDGGLGDGYVMAAAQGRSVRWRLQGYGGVVRTYIPDAVSSITSEDSGRHRVVFDGVHVTFDDDSVLASSVGLAASTTLKFGVLTASTGFTSVRIYGAKFWDGGVLVRDLVPYSGPRGVGLLDKVNDVLYTNAGGGSLTYGEEGGAWTNPYITDGLIGMWDAEWNEAGGAHNPELMQLNDLTGNLFPMPVAILENNWASRSENPSFSYADHPSLALLLNSEGYREHTVEGYSSFDPSLASISGNKYAFASLLSLKNASSGSNVSVQLGYGLDGKGKCANLRGFVTLIISDVDGADGVGRTFSCSTLQKPGGFSIGYLDGVEYGRYGWSTGSVYSYVNTFAFGATGNYWDKIKTSCLRIYNRVLTPEEVAHNARVDRERFGGVE